MAERRCIDVYTHNPPDALERYVESPPAKGMTWRHHDTGPGTPWRYCCDATFFDPLLLRAYLDVGKHVAKEWESPEATPDVERAWRIVGSWVVREADAG